MGLRVIALDDHEPSLIGILMAVDNEAFGCQSLTPWTLACYLRFGKVLVGYEKAQVVAVGEFVRDWNNPANAYLAGLAVKTESQNKGYGTLLLRQALGQLAREGISSVMLHVSPANLRALHIYKKLGFREIALHEVQVEDRATYIGRMLEQMLA